MCGIKIPWDSVIRNKGLKRLFGKGVVKKKGLKNTDIDSI